MIIKTLSRKSNTGQLVSYVFKYVFKEQRKNFAKPEQSKSDKGKFIIRYNIRSRSVKGFIKEFNENEKYRLVHRKDSVKLFHTIISFSNKDKEHINDKLLKDIAQKFISERGLNNMYAGTKHENKDHIHIHLIISGTSLNGRSSRISKQKFHSIKLALTKYQQEKYPKELSHSLPEHGKGKRIAKEAIVQQIKTERQTDKQALIECLEKAYSGSKSQEQFLSLLNQSGHQPYFRNGALQGVRFKGQMKYRLANLGFDKTKLQTLGQAKPAQDKTLSKLRQFRGGRDKDIKRTILEPDLRKTTTEVLDKNEQKAMDELSAIRGSYDDKEIDRDEANEDYNRDHLTEELSNDEDETKETSDENHENEFAAETEEAI